MHLDFLDITPEMRDDFCAYTAPWQLQGSEYNFNNLLMWGKAEHIKLAWQGGTMFVCLCFGTEPPFMLAPLTLDRNADYRKALDTASDYMANAGAKPLFKGILGNLVRAYTQAGGYTLEEDRENFDYVYTADSLITLSGKKLHAKRNHINQFKANYEYEYVRLTPKDIDECMDVYLRWLETQDLNAPGVLGEMDAIRTAITHMETLDIKGGGIRIAGKLEAFTLGERMDTEMALIHIEKANSDITGLYTFINQQFVEHEFSDMRLINREEDMGLEGLRKAKLSYYPVMLIEKYEGRPL